MLDLTRSGNSASQNLLSQFQIQVQESPNARAIDATGQMDAILSATKRERITPQGQQSVTGGSVLDDFINPKPFKTEDGRTFDPRSGEFLTTTEEAQLGDQDFGIKSVTVTRPTALKEN